VVKQAEDVGIEKSVILSLAARLKPGEKLDLARAIVEVSHAVDVAVNLVKQGASGSSDELVDEVLKRIAERTKANDATGATREAEEGFARWEKQESERRAKETARGVALMQRPRRQGSKKSFCCSTNAIPRRNLKLFGSGRTNSMRKGATRG
jgi:hypothetical protein